MVKQKLERLFHDAWVVFKRFPLAVFSSLILTIIAYDPSRLPLVWKKETIILSLILSILLLIALKLRAEVRNWSIWLTLFVSAALLGVKSFYLHHLPIPFAAYIFPFINLGLGLIFLVMVIPFLRTRASRENIWIFNYQVWSQVLFAGLTCLILGVGVSFILFSLDYLLHFKLFYDQYYYLVITLSCFIFPLLAMKGIPTSFDEKPSPDLGKGVQFLLNHVISPLWIVFGLIIIVYAIKTLYLQNLPRGLVSYLVALLGGTGVLAYVLGDREGPYESKAHRIFRRCFFSMLLIPLALMGFGLITRIQQYGFTPSRYNVALLFLWLVGCSVYAILFHREKLSRILIASASGLLILGSFGPWGVLELSIHSQVIRLQTLLEKNQILVNGEIQKSHPVVPVKDEHEISSILIFINRHGMADKLKGWFGPEGKKLFEVSDSNHNLPAALAKQMRIEFRYSGQNDNSRYFSVERSKGSGGWTFVDGFDYAYDNVALYFDDHFFLSKYIDDIKIPRLFNTEFDLKYNRSKQSLILKQKGVSQAILTIDIAAVGRKLKDETDPVVIDKELMFEGNNDTFRARLVLRTLHGKLDDVGVPHATSFKGYLLLKKVSKTS